MKIGLLSSMTAGTGNVSLLSRLQKHLESAQHEVTVFDVNVQQRRLPLFHKDIRRFGISFFFGIHLYRSGSLLMNSKTKYCLIIGGTDINEHSKHEEYVELMKEAVKQASAVVSFSPALSGIFCKLWPDMASKLVCIPPAPDIFVPREYQFPQRPAFSLTDEKLSYKSSDVVFLLPTNLRPVKDPMYLVDEMESWHKENSNIHLLIIGPAMDPNYTQTFLLKMQGLKGVKYHPAIPHIQLQEAIIQSTAILNTSVSEGLSTVLLEAMWLQKPILARNNVGNASILTHGVTGLLFSSKSEFCTLARNLLESPELQKALVRNARDLLLNRYSLERERSRYLAVLNAEAADAATSSSVVAAKL